MREPDRSIDRAFAQQVTEELIDRCRRHAQRWLRYYGVPGGAALAEELVQAVLLDVAATQVAWDPARSGLESCVSSVVRYRVRDMRRAQGRRAALGDESIQDDSAVEEVDMNDHEVASADGPDVALSRKQGERVAIRIVETLATMADGEGAALIACARAGITERADVCAETGMSEEAYRNARRRLGRLKDRLPEELRAIAMEVVA